MKKTNEEILKIIDIRRKLRLNVRILQVRISGQEKDKRKDTRLKLKGKNPSWLEEQGTEKEKNT